VAAGAVVGAAELHPSTKKANINVSPEINRVPLSFTLSRLIKPPYLQLMIASQQLIQFSGSSSKLP
jgi:hypothetical protein